MCLSNYRDTETSYVNWYYIIDASNNEKICEIKSKSDNILQQSVLWFKGLIEKELMNEGKDVIGIQDQYLIYNNQIMSNTKRLSQYLGDMTIATIYLQHGIECIKCRQICITFEECKTDNDGLNDNLKELNQKYIDCLQSYEELKSKNSKLESDIFDLNFQNNTKADKIALLQTQSQKQQQDIIYLNALNEIKHKTSNQEIKQIVEDMKILKKQEIKRQKQEHKAVFSMNRFEDYASYFGDKFPMEASILSYYEWIGFIISLSFTNDEECKFGDIMVRWITFSLFFSIPFVIGIYKITQSNSNNKQKKW